MTVVELAKEILPGLDKRTSGELRKQLTKRGVEFKLNTSIDGIDDKTVNFSDGEKKEFDTQKFSEFEDQFQWFIFFGFILIIASKIFPTIVFEG